MCALDLLDPDVALGHDVRLRRFHMGAELREACFCCRGHARAPHAGVVGVDVAPATGERSPHRFVTALGSFRAWIDLGQEKQVR